MATPFRFLACDWMTGTVMAELPLVNGSFERRLNGTGAFSADLVLGDPAVKKIDPFTSTQPDKIHLYADLNGVLVGSWMIWTRSYDSTTKTLQLAGSETMSYFSHRYAKWPALVYTNKDQGFIVADLLLRALAYPGGTPANFSLNVNITTGITRTATFNPWELREVLNEISLLQAEDPGFDWATDVAYQGSPAVPTVTFTLSYPRRGISFTNSPLMFELPGNIQSYAWPEDGSSAANDCFGIGAGSGATTLIAEAAATQLVTSGGFPLLERVGSYKGITDQNTLQAKVAQDLLAFENDRMAPPATKWQGTGLIVPAVTVFADVDPVLGSYTVGDEARLRVTDERFPIYGTNGAGIDTAYRIVAYVIKPGDSGGGQPSTVTIAFGPSLAAAPVVVVGPPPPPPPPPPSPPPTPTGLALVLAGTPSAPIINISWSASAGATTYDVLRGGVSIQSNISTLTATDPTVLPGNTYGYTVDAKNSGGTSAQSGTVSINVPSVGGGTPPTPTGLALVLGGTTANPTVQLTWNASTGATSYDITRNGVLYVTGLVTTNSLDSNVLPGSTYVYSVDAKNSGGTSAQSGTQSITLATSTGGSGPPINSQADIKAGITQYNGGVSSTKITLPAGTTWSNGRVTGTGITTAIQQGALMVGNLCVLNNCQVDNVPNAFAAVYRSDDQAQVTITGGRYTGAGALGIGSGGGTWTLTGVEIDHNGVNAHSGPWGDVTGFEAGGWKGVGKVVVNNCNVHDNVAIGLWWDINGSGSCDNCDINDNEAGGIQFEISEGTVAVPFVVSNCRLLGNGYLAPGWFWNPAIGIYASFNVEIRNCTINTVHGAHSGGNGITLVQQTRTDSTPPAHDLANVNVHDNTVSGAGISGAVSDNGVHLAARNLVFAGSNVWNAPHQFKGDTSP